MSSEHAIYGDSLDHSSPLQIHATNIATLLALRLSKRTPRIAVNTFAAGIMINPQTLTTQEAQMVLKAIQQELQAVYAAPKSKL